jgi:hypothetical protein
MKTLILAMVLFFSLCPGLLWADDFLGAPLPPGGKIISQTESRLEKTYDMPYEEILAFYTKALKGEEDIKFRDRSGGTFIEEYNTRPWHSITIKSGVQGGSTLVVLKDNWTWIMGTLIIRFFGVFGILIALFIALSISGAIQKALTAPSDKDHG